jgi:hypothetical protein
MIPKIMQCIIENDVGIAAAITECVDRGSPEPIAGPEEWLFWELEVPLVNWDLGVWFLEPYIRRHDTMLKNQNCLNEASNAGRAFQMAYIGLDSTN